MNILFVGDLSWITPKFCDVFKREKHKLVLAQSNSALNLAEIQGAKLLRIDPADENFLYLLGAYHFNAVVYFAVREETLNVSSTSLPDINSVTGIKNALLLGEKNKDMRFFLISSSETLPPNGRNDENEEIHPETVNGYAIQALENTCKHFRKNQNQMINIVRVPYLFDEEAKAGLMYELLTSTASKDPIELPSKHNGIVQFLHSHDLAEFLLLALEEPYNEQSNLIHLYPGEDQNWFELAEWIKNEVPGSVTTFKPTIQWRTSPLAGTIAKKYYDWSAKRSFNDLRTTTLANLDKDQIREPSAFEKFR